MHIIKYNFSPISISIATVIMLSACGGGGSDSADNANNNNDYQQTPVDPLVIVPADTVDPVIKLTGPSAIDVIQGANYVEEGATAADDQDGNITNSIAVGGEIVNTNAAPGATYTLTYNVSDEAGNPAIEVTRSVSIISANPDHQIPALSAATIQDHLTAINNARAVARTCGVHGYFPAVAAVTWNEKLYKAAYEHTQDLTETNTFGHDGSATISDWSGYILNKSSSMLDRVATYGYSLLRLSENVAAGGDYNTAQAAVDAWLRSDDHCVNVMDANVTEVGMALVINQDTTYIHYWTQNFGRPK